MHNNSNWFRVSILAAGLAFVVSCASVPENGEEEVQPMTVLENIQHSLRDTRTRGSESEQELLPDSVSSALLPPVSTAAPFETVEAVEPRFDVAVDRVYARSFFLSLVKDTPYNMVVHPEVKGKITLHLKDATIPEVMEMVYNTYGYEYEKRGMSYIVRPNALQSRIFRIDYLNVMRKGESETRVSSGQPTSTNNEDDNNNNTFGTTIGGDRNSTTIPASKIKTESKVEFWSELRVSVEAIIGDGEGKNVVVSPQSGLVVVRAYPSEIRKVEEFLSFAQEIMQRQVVLEAKVLEVELNDGYQQGINWAALSNNGKYGIGQTGGGRYFKDGVSDIEGNAGNLDPGNFTPIAGNIASAFGGVFTLTANEKNFKAFFEFLETQGNIQVLSNPRVSTVNNQKAVIKVGSDEFFVTDISSTTTAGVATTTTPQVTLTPFFSGIALDVTPQIDENGDVILHIHPTISDVQDQEKVITVANEVLQLPLAFSTVRESDSIIRAKNGQVVVIGGLMKNVLRDEEAATPILSDIPLLGPLFKQIQTRKVKSELVILLRPIVVDRDEVWQEAISESSTRVKQIYHGYDKN